MNWNIVKKALKWTGIGLGRLLGVLVIALVVLYFLGGMRVNKIYDIPAAATKVPTDAASIERGKHVIETRGLCKECHGKNLGGQVLDGPLSRTSRACRLLIMRYPRPAHGLGGRHPPRGAIFPGETNSATVIRGRRVRSYEQDIRQCATSRYNEGLTRQ